MGCGSSKVADQDPPHDQLQNDLPPVSAQPGHDLITAIQPPTGTVHSVHETKSITDPIHIESEIRQLKVLEDKLVIKIRDLSHPLAIVINYLSSSTPIVIQQDSTVCQPFIAEAEGIGHDMALIKYICTCWQTSLLHEGTANAVVDEWICHTLFHLLPAIQAISAKWAEAGSGSVQYLRWESNRAISTISSYADNIADRLKESSYLCNNAISLSDIVAAACLQLIIQLRHIFNRLPLDRLDAWLDRLQISPSTERCQYVLALSDTDQCEKFLDTAKLNRLNVVFIFNESFHALSDIVLEKLPTLITYSDEGRIDSVNDLEAIHSMLCEKSLINAASTKTPNEPDAKSGTRLTAYVCPTCSSLECLSPDQVALVLFAPDLNIRVDAHSNSSKELVCFQDQLVRLSETPAILRYLSRSQNVSQDCTIYDMAMIDENLTFISQRLVPVVNDIIHGLSANHLLELSMESAHEILLPVNGGIHRPDRVYLAAIAFCLRRCQFSSQLSPRIQEQLDEWLLSIPNRSASNLFSLLTWKSSHY